MRRRRRASLAAFSPPDEKARHAQNGRDDAGDAKDDAVRDASDPAEMEVIEPDGERAAAFHAGRSIEVGEFAGAAIDPHDGVAPVARRVERAFHLIAMETKVGLVETVIRNQHDGSVRSR